MSLRDRAITETRRLSLTNQHLSVETDIRILDPEFIPGRRAREWVAAVRLDEWQMWVYGVDLRGRTGLVSGISCGCNRSSFSGTSAISSTE